MPACAASCVSCPVYVVGTSMDRYMDGLGYKVVTARARLRGFDTLR